MPKRQEVLCIHIGQAGVQIGNAVWELYCLEHGIRPDGYLYREYAFEEDFNAVFALSPIGKVVPRAVMVDLEPSVIDEIRHGAYRDLFPPHQLLTGKEDAANNYARGYYSIGPEMLDLVLDRVRMMAELSPSLQGFFIFRSYGGGTGAGFTALLLEQLASIFPKKSKLLYSVYPAPKISPTIVEPYNAILTTHGCIDFEHCSFLLDNEASYDILGRCLDVPSPTYTNINRLLGQVVSAMTTSLRFEGQQHADLVEFQTNLVPYPRIHYPIITYAPFLASRKILNQDVSVVQLANECFEPYNQMLKCNPSKGKYIACSMFFRGDVSPTDVNYAIHVIKSNKRVNFVKWCPTGFKVAINYQPPTTVPVGDLAPTPRAVCMLANNSAIWTTWAKLSEKFSLMFTKRAFIHHFVAEGIEESEFFDAVENVAALVADYKDIESL